MLGDASVSDDEAFVVMLRMGEAAEQAWDTAAMCTDIYIHICTYIRTTAPPALAVLHECSPTGHTHACTHMYRSWRLRRIWKCSRVYRRRCLRATRHLRT